MVLAVLGLSVYSAVVTLALVFIVLDHGHRLHVFIETRKLRKEIPNIEFDANWRSSD